MKIAFYQFEPQLLQTKANLEKICNAISNTNKHIDLLVLPELSTSGYFITDKSDLKKCALNANSPEIDKLKSICKEKNMNIILGTPEIDKENIYNSSFWIKPNGDIKSYRKNHLFYKEKLVFKTGDGGFPIFNINGIKIAMLICFDHMFPEAARTLALKGVQIICHPSNLVIPEYAQLTSRVRALENRIFWIMANRIGSETNNGETLKFTGASQIVSPKGEILISASDNEECIKIVEINPKEALNKDLNKLNNLFNDRRPDIYKL